MNQNDRFKMDVMMNLEDDVVEKGTQMRIARWGNVMQKRRKRTNRLLLLSSAASLFVVFGVLILVVLLGKHVPVYTGMTVSGALSSSETVARANPEDYMMLCVKDNTMRVIPMSQQINAGSLMLLDATQNDLETPEVSVEAGEKIYYARTNQDIYITVHVDNPDNFVILQFTLNGKVYNSYMFEEGSDMEHLILKYNVGTELGVQEYTLDNIQYVDNGVYKDVRLDGADTTVSVSIAPEESKMPTAELALDSVYSGGARVKVVSLVDAYGLLDDHAELYAELYTSPSMNEKDLVCRKSISKDDTFVEFEDLMPQTSYVCVLFATYEAFDGNGISKHILGKQAFDSEILIEVTSLQAINNTGFVDLSWDRVSVREIEKIELVRQNGEAVSFLEGADCSIQGEEKNHYIRSLTNVPYGEYILRVTFLSSNGKRKTVNLENVIVSPYQVSFGMRGTIAMQYSGDLQIYNPSTKDYRNHWGTDVLLSSGVSVYAVTDGVVTAVSNEPNAGLVVEITYFVQDEPLFKVRYLGLGETVSGVGDTVRAGDLLGGLSSSPTTVGCVSEPHLHVELWLYHEQTKEWESVDPFDGYFYIPEATT